MEGAQHPDDLSSNKTELLLIDDNIKDKTVYIFVPSQTSKCEALVQKKHIRKPLLSTFDIIVCLLVLAPSVVGFWRGTWSLLELYNKYTSPWLCLFLGVFVHIVFLVVQDNLNKFINQKATNTKTKILKILVTRLYTYIFAVTTIMHWRGGWEYIDQYFNLKKNSSGTVLKENSGIFMLVSGGTFLVLILLRSLRNCIAPPFLFCTDNPEKTFTIPTRFRIEVHKTKYLYLLDCLFSVLIVGTLVLFLWRGVWALLDIYLYPENELWSAWGSLIVGYGVVILAFVSQYFLRRHCDRITGLTKVVVADLFIILSIIGTVNVWRGIWNLFNLYLFPDNLELSCWINHSVCLTILLILKCTNSLLVRGVYIDGEELAGGCVMYPCYYLRLIIEEEKSNKLQKEQEKNKMLNDMGSSENDNVKVQDTI